ncbi:MAG TPA: TadE/TadG family type IV pilus assembly protein [Nocardioides sp.]|nr:TadE/TadG family type IV pilus assembly protein [Nocardioides sp.]
MGRRSDSERGSAVVDFVLVVVLLVPLFLGLLQVALVLHVRNSLGSAAAEGARLAATVGSGPEEGLARTRAQIVETVGTRYVNGVEPRRVLVDGAPAIEIVVHARVPALGLGGPAISFDVEGRAVQEDPP